MTTQSEELAQFACDTQLSDVPQVWIDKVKEHVLDTLGVTLLGASVPTIAPLRDYALRYGASGKSRLVGPKTRTIDAEDAAMFNATASMATELDTHHVASSHPCSVVPAGLAVAEELGSTGSDFLRAMIVAFEITNRLAIAATTSIVFDRGFVNSCVFNGFGVAAGTGMLLGLDTKQMTHAFAIAGAQASGIAENARTATGRFHAGIPAMNGIRSARLAQLGLRGAESYFEGKLGFMRAFTVSPKAELLTQGLGTDYPGIDGLRLKHPYASVGNLAPQIEALHEILAKNDLHHTEIAEIRVGSDPLMYVTGTETAPSIESMTDVHSVTAGHFSPPIQLALRAVKGRNDFPTLLALAQGGFRDPDVQRIAHLVKIELDPECAALYPERWMAKIRVTTHDGRSFEERAFAMGEPDVFEKLNEILEPIIPSQQITSGPSLK